VSIHQVLLLPAIFAPPKCLAVRLGKLLLVGEGVGRECADLLRRRPLQTDGRFLDLVLCLVHRSLDDRGPALIR
jgi:hypothetical protein